MGKKKYIVTVINSISETSMPFNEFVLYRHNFSPNDKQLLIVCSNTIPDSIVIPDGLRVQCVGYNGKKIREIMRQVEIECNTEGMELIVHLHQPKSAAMFNLSTIFDNYRKRTLFTVHSLYDAYSIKNKILSVVSALLASKVTCVSEASYAHYPKLVKKVKKNNILALQNGVNLKRIESVVTSCEDKKNNIKSLIYIARMIPIKNHKFLIEVMSQLTLCKLILIGAEDNNGEIRKMIETRQLTDRVELIGLIPRDEVYRRLKQADIYVSPSLVEGLPVSVLEAMYVGLPIVISNIQPHLEIGARSERIVTLPLDENRWVEMLNNYLNMDNEELKQIGIDCKYCAQEYFSLDKMLERYDKLYEEL